MILPRKNKKGIIGVVIFVLLLFVLLLLAVIMAFGSATLNWVFDEAVPELSNLGVVGGTNLTDVAGSTITPLNNIIQSFQWLAGVLYVMGLIGVMGMAFAFRGTPNKWLIGFFVLLVLVLVMGSMFMSNIYEEFYNNNDELGSRLKEQAMLSYMILYSPMIMSIIAFISGIILFSGRQEEGFV